MFPTENFLSIETIQSAKYSFNLNSQNAPLMLQNLKNQIPSFQEFINVQMNIT